MTLLLLTPFASDHQLWPILDAIHAILLGQASSWPVDLNPPDGPALAALLDQQGVAPLLRAAVSTTFAWDDWPPDLRSAIEQRALAEAVAAQARREVITRVLDQSPAHPLLLFKGAALGYQVYAHPSLRPACDIDLLIHPDTLASAETVLAALGYTRNKFHFQQVTFAHPAPAFLMPPIDVHWAISEARVISREFTIDELMDRSVALPALHPAARALSPVDALLVAGAHMAHHRQWTRLLWLHDVRLLVERLTEPEIALFIDLARSKRLHAVCRAALTLALDDHHVARSPALAEFIRTGPHLGIWREPSAHFVAQRHRPWHDLMIKIRGRTWRERAQLLSRLLPSGPGLSQP